MGTILVSTRLFIIFIINKRIKMINNQKEDENIILFL
jgi:hypothetical protein